MKKTLAAAMISSIFASGASYAANIYQGEDGSEVNVYGRLGYNITDKATNNGDTEGQFDARIGLGGSQRVNDQVSVIGWAEYQVGAAEAENGFVNGGEELTARYVWAGIDAGDVGKITGGRVASGIIWLSDIVDVFHASDVALGRQIVEIDNSAVQTFRQDGTLQYQNNFGGLDVSVAYIFGDGSSEDGSANAVLDYGYNTALRYGIELGNGMTLTPVVAYQYNENKGGDESTFWGAGANFVAGNLTVGMEYSENELDFSGAASNSKDEVFEAIVAYNINDFVTVRGGYRNLDNTGGDELELDEYTLEGQYRLTSQSSIYADYVMRDGNNGFSNGFAGDADEDFYNVGLRYEF
ncbi:porin [Photobacterium sp. GJ3]|uniref:porin n=1 Tax=Photobacterium sp. GJ3 TaxID=2829502 RepID=UPI001B8C6ADD|nr:porin [Photobacterium sp. GJ3]QUJ68172.1 porin [Photobacterium sp. GJ3]